MQTPQRGTTLEVDAQHRTSVLVVDDEDSFQDLIAGYLRDFRVLKAYSGWEALESISKHHVDVVLLDLNLPDTTGLRLLEQIREERDDLEVIILTGHSEIRNAVEAVKRGAFDFIAKSYENYQQISEHIERALTHRRRRREQAEATARQQWLRDAFQLLDQSQTPEVKEIARLLRQVADTPLTVLLQGESGVGKEILARYVHAYSDRASGPFIAVNLTAIPDQLLESHLFGHERGAFTGAERTTEGKFERAEGGTLFLDEIAELDVSAQAKILRALQEREIERIGARETIPIDVRIVAASNKDLVREVEEGRFREDLFFRLNVVRIEMPPLRRRKGDIPALAKLLVQKHAGRMRKEPPRITEDAMTVLQDYEWPGNVRELENLVMRLVALKPGRGIVADDIPPEYCLATLNRLAHKRAHRSQRGADDDRLYYLARDQFERYLVRLMVDRCRGDKKAAARALGIGLTTLKQKLRGERTDWQELL